MIERVPRIVHKSAAAWRKDLLASKGVQNGNHDDPEWDICIVRQAQQITVCLGLCSGVVVREAGSRQSSGGRKKREMREGGRARKK